MMNMRTVIVSVAAMTLGLGALPAFAQPVPGDRGEARRPAGRPGGPGGPNMERIFEQLDLNEVQKKQVGAIMDEQRQRIAAATEESRKKLNEVLTEEQRTKMRELMRDQRGPGGPPTTQPLSPIDRMQGAVLALDLSDAQKVQMKEIFAKYRTEFEALHKDAGGDREAMQQQARPLMQEMRAQVSALLTPEQSEKLQQQMGEWRERGDRPGAQDRPRGADGEKRRKRDGANKE